MPKSNDDRVRRRTILSGQRRRPGQQAVRVDHTRSSFTKSNPVTNGIHGVCRRFVHLTNSTDSSSGQASNSTKEIAQNQATFQPESVASYIRSRKPNRIEPRLMSGDSKSMRTRRRPHSDAAVLPSRNANASNRVVPKVLIFAFAFAGLCIASGWPGVIGVVDASRSDFWGVDRQVIADSIGNAVVHNIFPLQTTLTTQERSFNAKLRYGFNPTVQQAAEKVFNRYRPDYGAFAAVNPDTGQVLSLVSFTRSGENVGNLALRGTFPAASIFKIITAAAAIDQGRVTENTVIPFNGKSTSLYKKQVFNHKNNKWTRRQTLRESFARSSNPVFGQLGVFHVGASGLQEYAGRFGFNEVFVTDIPFDSGRMGDQLLDAWSIAETASGFTRSNTLSPLHGALMAATMINNGTMIEPHLVNKVTDDFGIVLYEPLEMRVREIVSPKTARQMRSLMRATVHSGSAKKQFKGFFRGVFADADVGGKTGSLTGFEPKGKYDWFVGYGSLDGKKIAYAALCINVEKWYVKSSYVARKVLEAYLKPSA